MKRSEAVKKLKYLASCTAVTEDFAGLDEALDVAIGALADPWIPVSDRPAAKDDANQYGQIEVWGHGGARLMGIDTALDRWNQLDITHWRTPAGPREAQGDG